MAKAGGRYSKPRSGVVRKSWKTRKDWYGDTGHPYPSIRQGGRGGPNWRRSKGVQRRA